MAAPIVPLLILGGGVLLFVLGGKKTAQAATPSGGGGGGVVPPHPDIDSSEGPPQPVRPPPSVQEQKARSYQAEVIAAVQMLHYNDKTDSFNPLPDESAIQYTTGLVARMRADGFVLEAEALNKLVTRAIAAVPSPPVVVIASIPKELQQELDNALLYCKDPAKLRAIADALAKLPGAATDPAIKTAIEMLLQKAAQMQAQMATGDALQHVDVIMTGQGTVNINLPGPAVANPLPTVVPPVSVPKTPVEIAADMMVAHLKRLQISAGNVKNAKGKEDKAIVKKFQGLANLTQDGKPGPGTLVSAASNGQYELPLVMYWPAGATSQKVYDYRNALLALASKLEPTNKVAADQLRASAAREKGQAGIVGGTLKD